MDFNFIENNFFPKNNFLIITQRASSIRWNLLSGKITSLNNLSEYIGLLDNYILNLNNENQNIKDIINSNIYKQIWNCLARFIILRKKYNQKQLILTFTLLHRNEKCQVQSNVFVHISLHFTKNQGQLYIVGADELTSLNTSLFFIIEPLNTEKERICFASTFNNKRLYLINNEYLILSLLSRGFSTDSIAKYSNLSKYTVDEIRQNLLRKFKAHNTFQLINHAYKEGYI
ncbi:MAG: LuxR C-terminal-related transcriptional regulator [Bacteroidales bacterium]